MNYKGWFRQQPAASLLQTYPEAQEACSRSLCVSRMPQEERKVQMFGCRGRGSQERMRYYFT